MAKNYIQPGNSITLVAPADVVSGGIVTVGKIAGVAQTSALSGAEVEVAVTGVWSVPKTSAQAWTVGAIIYSDGTKATTSDASGANPRLGHAMAIAANPSPTGIVRLNG